MRCAYSGAMSEQDVAPQPGAPGAWRALVVAVVAGACLLAAFFLGLRLLGEVTAGQQWVMHTVQVQLRTERLRTDLRGLGRAVLDRLASGTLQAADVEPWRDRLRVDLAELQEMVRDNPAQEARLAQMARKFTLHLDAIAALRLADAQQLEARRARAADLEHDIATFFAEESRLLQQRQRHLADSVQRHTVAIVVLGLIATSLVGAAVVLIVNLAKARARAAAAQHRADELQAAHARTTSLARQLLDVEEAERRALARELHDDVGQRLAALKMHLQVTQAMQAQHAPQLGEAVAIVDDCIAQVRHRAFMLRPAHLEELGLAAAVRSHVEDQARLAGVQARVEVELGDRRPPVEWSAHVFRIVQEGVRNALVHGRPSLVEVRIACADGQCELSIADDGLGMSEGAPAGLGLLHMRERAELLGGSFEIGPAPGGGTRLRCRWPMPQDHAEDALA